MERYRIVKEIRYSGCIPIVVYCVQVRKDKRLSSEWVNVKGFDTYKRAKELLDVLNGDYSMIRNLCREIIKEEIADRLSIDISLKREGDKIMLNEQEP